LKYNEIPREGQTLSGTLFSEPMRVETVRPAGENQWSLGLVGVKTGKFIRVNLSEEQFCQLEVISDTPTYAGDGKLLRLALQAYALGIAYEFDPYFGLSLSRVDPLPHQLEAVYDYLLKLPQVRFLLADDAGAGKTIMAGLLIRELKLRGLVEKVLIVGPANLAFQWQRELKDKFNETFVVMKGYDVKDQYGVNQWLKQKQVITSLDLAKREDILPSLKQVRWDLVIVDEAHRMSWTPHSKKTARYALGELLSDTTDHFLLLTATPHKGDPENFSLFLQLLDRDAYADVKSIEEAMERKRAPFYIRRVKEAMVYFPQLQPDGKWAAKRIFTNRIPNSADFKIDGDEFDLYRDITRYVKFQSNRAAAQGNNARARAVGFRMALYQRRLASSIYSIRRSLERSADRMERLLKEARELILEIPPDLPSPEELEEMEEAEREKYELLLEAISLADNEEDVREEIEGLRDLAAHAQTIEDIGTEAKLSRLKDLLQQQGFMANPDQRLLVFTEFKDTLDYLVGKLTDWGFRVGCIHGGMKIGARDIPHTRLYTEQQFREGDIQVLVATEAAGEGINLQCCHILFNYDIPWNPNRLEQRMGRIHRYGQTHDCLIFNFVATNTIEGRVLKRLTEKLNEIRNALEDDAVFNVVGEILPAAHIDRVLKEYYAGKLGDEDLEERILHNVDEEHFRAICQNALEGLATRNLNLEMLLERKAKAQERRLVPETIARFIHESAEYTGLSCTLVPNQPHTFDIGRVPTTLKTYDQEPDWPHGTIAAKYPRCSTDRTTAENKNLEWVTPGHPLFEAIRQHIHTEGTKAFHLGACFHALDHEEPSRIDLYRARAVDGLGKIIHERIFAVELIADAEPTLKDPAMLGNLTLAPVPDNLPPSAHLEDASVWLDQHALQPFLQEIRQEREEEINRIAYHVDLSLTRLLEKADEEIGRAAAERDEGVQGAEGRLAQAENRHAALMARREKRREEMARQRSVTLQDVERITSILVLPHPDREAPDLTKMRPNLETEAIAMRVVMEHEEALGRQIYDVHEKNLGYDVTSLDLTSGELRLIEVKGLQAKEGTILLSPNERRVAEDRRDCYWLYVVTNCAEQPMLQEPIKDPARFPWHEVSKVQHYWLEVKAMTQPMEVRDNNHHFGSSLKEDKDQ